MSAAVEEPIALEFLVDAPAPVELDAREQARREILAANLEAAEVEGGDLAAFLDLLAGADAQYLAADVYVPEPPRMALDWDAVSEALSHSQGILIGVQKLLSETLAVMGVEDHQIIRVYENPDGSLRLLADHPRRQEIEAALNGPENQDLRTLYHAAVDGMSLAGGLVGAVAVPEAVLEQVKAKHSAA